MTIRERLEQNEKAFLSPYAAFSSETKGREFSSDRCDLRTEFQRDRDRIIHCKSFRRLKHKTQVFLSPESDHYRTRLTHTLEVSQIARTIARSLMLNEDLVEAMSLGHDLGHTPFGHMGERSLNRLSSFGFKHNEQSLRVVDVLEKNHRGLNLTAEVREGILKHTGKELPETMEGRILRFADRIAYVNHDIDDAIRARVLDENEIPRELRETLGDTNTKRIDSMIKSVVRYSDGKNDVCMEPQMQKAADSLRDFMFEHVYTIPSIKREEEKVNGIITAIYRYFKEHIDKLPPEYLSRGDAADIAITDYIAGMSDRFAISFFEELFVPKIWQI